MGEPTREEDERDLDILAHLELGWSLRKLAAKFAVSVWYVRVLKRELVEDEI